MTIMTKLTREFSFSTGGTSGLLMPYPFMLILKTKGSAFTDPLWESTSYNPLGWISESNRIEYEHL